MQKHLRYVGNSNQNGDSESTPKQVDKEPKLTNLGIVIFNFVPDTELEQLKEGLKQIYGDLEPVEAASNVVPIEGTYHVPPDALLNKTVYYYDYVENLQKSIPDEIEYFEIMIISRIPGWNEVVCSGKLKDEYLEIAKQEFIITLETKKTISLPITVKKAHEQFESFLSDSIMENINYKSDTEKRKNYPYAYVGGSAFQATSGIMELIEKTDYTRGMIGWGIQDCFSIIYQSLIAPHGGYHLGLTIPQRGFSLLNTNPDTCRGPTPHADIMIRKLKATSHENWVINTISLILLMNILLAYRLKQIARWEGIIAQSWCDIQGIKNADNEELDLGKLYKIHDVVSKHMSEYLHESFIIKKECNDLITPIDLCNGFLLYEGSNELSMEVAFCDSYVYNEETKKEEYSCKHIEVGPLLRVVEKTKMQREQLLSELNRISEQQQNLSSHFDSITNIFLQKRMENLNSSMIWLTRIILGFTILAVFVAVVAIFSDSLIEYYNVTSVFP